MNALDHTGEYYLTGVMETGCGLKLNADLTFDFFYSYGALDRHGYGTWQKNKQNEIELNTNYQDLLPFTISLEEKRENAGIKICIPNYNQILQKNTKIEIINNQISEEQVADKSGTFKFSTASVEKMIITCLFYFDNPAILIPVNTSSNYFELTPNHNLPLVHFNNSKFRVEENELIGNLHLLDDFKEYKFVK